VRVRAPFARARRSAFRQGGGDGAPRSRPVGRNRPRQGEGVPGLVEAHLAGDLPFV
jgi:hypothetical protein